MEMRITLFLPQRFEAMAPTMLPVEPRNAQADRKRPTLGKKDKIPYDKKEIKTGDA